MSRPEPVWDAAKRFLLGPSSRVPDDEADRLRVLHPELFSAGQAARANADNFWVASDGMTPGDRYAFQAGWERP